MPSNYIVFAQACICECKTGRKELSTHNVLDRAIQTASGHWSVYVTFFGDLTHWLDFIVVDTRDGVIEWKNGQPTRKAQHGQATSNPSTTRRGRNAKRPHA